MDGVGVVTGVVVIVVVVAIAGGGGGAGGGDVAIVQAVGFHDTSSATSCPEDVNYLGYPWGPSLNISEEIVSSNMRYWSPGTRTCVVSSGTSTIR